MTPPKNPKNLKRTLKVTALSVVGLLLAFLLVSFINHKIQTPKEFARLKDFDTGEIITIDGKNVNYKIFNPDQTDRTLVLMPGLNVQNLALLFEPLAEKIDARIILINRPGYAFSEETGRDASLEYIVEYHRKVLAALGITEPVVLMPHSISGIYAMYWAEKYPDEVDGIIALDVGSPELYLDEDYQNSSWLQDHFLNLATKLGLHRFFMLDEASRKLSAETLVQTGHFSPELAEAASTLGMANAYPDFVVSESTLNRQNAEEILRIRGKNYANTEKFFIMADMFADDYFETYMKASTLKTFGSNETAMNEYLEQYKEYRTKNQVTLSGKNAEFATVPGPHAIYEYPTADLASKIKAFLSLL